MESNVSPEDIKAAYWQQLYKEAGRYRSELEFYEGEIRFLRSLLSRYLHWLLEEEQYPRVHGALEKLNHVEKEAKTLHSADQSVTNRLAMLLENPFTQNEPEVLASFRQTREDLQDLITDFRDVKQEIFTMVEQTMRTEKAKRLLGVPAESSST